MEAKEIETGGQAFPVEDIGIHGSYGMTLRDYFAAKAMQAMNTNPYWDEKDFYEIARAAYQMAGAMLKERTE